MPLSNSKSESETNTTLARDYGQAANNSVITNPGSVGVNKKGKYVSGLDLSKTKVTGDLVFGDPETVTLLADTYTQSINELNAANSAALQKALNLQAAQQEKALAAVKELSESSQTGGASSYSKYTLYLAGGVLLLLGVLFYRR